MVDKNYILNKEAAQLKLERLALEIAEELNGDITPLVLIGITSSGMVIAQKMNDLLKQYFKEPIQLISATLNKAMPSDVELSEQVDFNQKILLFVMMLPTVVKHCCMC